MAPEHGAMNMSSRRSSSSFELSLWPLTRSIRNDGDLHVRGEVDDALHQPAADERPEPVRLCGG